MKHLHYISIFLVLLTSCTTKKTDNSIDKDFDNFKNYYVETLWKISPSSAIYAGFHKYDSLLIAPSQENRSIAVAQYKSLLDSLNAYNENLLSESNKIDLWMMKDNTFSSIWYLEEFKSHEWNPSNYNVAGEFAEILNGTYDKLDVRLNTFNLRLQQVPNYYEVAIKQIAKPTIEHTDLAIMQIEGSVEDVFGKSLLDSINASNLSSNVKSAFIVNIDNAKASINKFVAELKIVRSTLNESNARSFRIGEKQYEEKFKHDIQSGYTASDLFAKAIARKAELHTEMATISRKLWPKYFGNIAMPSDSLKLIRMMIDTISINHVNRDSFLQAIEQQIPTLVKFISDKNLIYIDPSKPLVVRRTPAYMEGVAGASISAPGPYDKNGNTYYNVSLLENYSPESAESYLREYNKYILQILNIHEAIPGHYTQLVYSNNSPSIVKSVLGNGAMVEGWAVYSERMMLENGYGNDEPEMWLMYYKWHLRSVCNTILDYSVHTKNMSEKDAKDLLVNGAFQQLAESEGKWNRVKLTQVQLCSYYNGFSEIYQLREDLKGIEGEKFNLKSFHEKFLSFGSAPVKYIRTLMIPK
jgi:uncharacterized protein (DUF885 family)